MTETPRTQPARPAADGVALVGASDAAPDAPTPEAARRLALSPSRAADFKQCPLLYRFRAIDRLPEVPSPAQVRGTLVHAVLDQLYALPAPQRTPATARALVGPAWQQLCEADPTLLPALFGEDHGPDDSDVAGCDDPGGAGQDGAAAAGARPAAAPVQTVERARPAGADVATWLAGVDPLLDAYFALEDPRRLEPEARELLVEAELESGLLLRGYVDRVDRADQVGTGDPTPAPEPERGGGAYLVIDYKTGTAPRPTTEARALFQMKFYALVLLLLRGRAPAELRLMYLTGPETLRYVPDEAQLRRFGRMLDAMWTAIRTAGATGEFRPNPGPGCAWCEHRARCPAWDGTPPPYPGWPAKRLDPVEAG